MSEKKYPEPAKIKKEKSNKKGWWKRFLERLAESNKESLGSCPY